MERKVLLRLLTAQILIRRRLPVSLDRLSPYLTLTSIAAHSTSSSEEEDSTILSLELSGPLIKNPGGERRVWVYSLR